MSIVRRPRVQREKITITEQPDDFLFAQEEQQPLLATNTGVRLACTMAAMLSPFAVFLCWAEKDSRVIRTFAVQSSALLCMHLFGVMILGLLSLIVGSIPYLGFLLNLLGWLIYVAIALFAIYLRVKLMAHAWHGRRFALPILERIIRRFY